jgi:hypothetical protein
MLYKISNINLKSARQQNLPAIINYPKRVAHIFPHFDDVEIPQYGKDNLGFL